MMYLLGLRDDYEHDGRVITQVLTNPNSALTGRGVTALGDCYKQLNSSVGEFGTATLQASTKAVESNSAGDKQYLKTNRVLAGLDIGRDQVAGVIKNDLEAAAFQNAPIPNAVGLTASCNALISYAERLAAS